MVKLTSKLINFPRILKSIYYRKKIPLWGNETWEACKEEHNKTNKSEQLREAKSNKFKYETVFPLSLLRKSTLLTHIF